MLNLFQGTDALRDELVKRGWQCSVYRATSPNGELRVIFLLGGLPGLWLQTRQPPAGFGRLRSLRAWAQLPVAEVVNRIEDEGDPGWGSAIDTEGTAAPW